MGELHQPIIRPNLLENCMIVNIFGPRVEGVHREQSGRGTQRTENN